jgi:hypothetical protein
MFQRLTLVLFLLGMSNPVRAATGTVSGTVALEDGHPAVGATVFLTDTGFGTATNEQGSFFIHGIPAGEYSVQVRLLGYRQGVPPTVIVRSSDTTVVSITLEEEAIELTQVEVTGTRRQGAEDVRPSVTTLAPHESKILPGAAEDVLRSLQALPGVTSVSDFSSQLVVRGSGPDQNLIMIDGFEVLNPYRLYGFVSMFNPETLSDISLQTGGFAAQYGDRLSAVLDVRNREGRSDVLAAGKINTSLTNMNIILEGRLPLEGSSYLLSLRRTYYDLILGPILKSAKLVKGDVALPNFRDLQAKIAVPIDPENKILFNVFTSRDGVDLVSGAERDRPDSVNVFDQSYNTLVGGTWQFTPNKNLVGQTQLSWYQNNGTGYFDGTFVDPSQNTGDLGRADTLGLRFVNFAVNYDYIYKKTTLTQRWLYNMGNHTIQAGYGVDVLRTDFIRYFAVDETLRGLIRSRGQVVPTDAIETNTYNRYNVYLQDRIALGDRLFVQPGLRYDLFPSLKTRSYFSPRLNISFKLSDLSTLRAAYGIFYQSPGMEKQDFRSRIVFTEDSFSSLVAEQAEHYILGFDRMMTPEWQFKTEVYYKLFTNSIVPEKLQGTRWQTRPNGSDIFSRSGWTQPVLIRDDSLTSTPVNDATGKSYGIEFMMQKIRTAPGDRFTGWVSYALSYAHRERGAITTPFLFDQRHAVNIVGNYRIGERWDVGMKFTLRSGRPYAKAVGVKPRVLEESVNGQQVPVIQVDGNNRVILDVDYEKETYSGRLNLYHSLDIRITTYPRWWGLQWSVYLDVQNVYNRENQQQLNYYIDSDGNLRERPINGIPLFPSLGLSVVF